MGAQILAYCLMGNHFHLAIKVAAATLGAFMQRLTGGYGAGFNHRHDRTGHLFESRYKDKLCLDDRYLLTLIHYIHMNPVRAGLVSTPEEWPWSSFKPMDGPFPNLDGFEPWDSEDETLDIKRTTIEIQSLDRLGEATFAQTGVTIERLKSRQKRDGATISARRKFVLDAIINGHTLASAARWLQTTRSTVSRYTLETEGQRREPHPNNATMGGLTPSLFP